MSHKTILKPKANFDLLPKNPRPGLLKPESTRVNVEISIETGAPVNSSKTDRWTLVAVREMERYRSIIVDTVEKQTSKWDKMAKADRERDAETLSKSINNALKSLEAAIRDAVQAQIKREAQGDKNLLEARIAVVAKGTFKVIAIGKDVAQIAVSGGADVKAWYSLAKNIYELGKLIADQAKNEATRRQDLLKAIGVYCTTKQTRWNEEKKAKDWKAKAKLTVKKIWTSQKDLANKCETERKKYRNEITVLIHNADKMGGKRDELLQLLNKAGSVSSSSIAKGKQMVDLQRAAHSLNARCLEAQDFVDDMAILLTENGIEVDDSTAMQKLKRLSNLGDVAKAGKELYDAAKDLQAVIEAIKSA